MSHNSVYWERVQAAVRGQVPLKVPYSLWRHFYDMEASAEGLAQAMVDWVHRYDFDFLKINPRAEYHSEVWGATYEYSKEQEVKHKRVSYPVRSRHDWHKVGPRRATDGSLGEQLQAIKLITRQLGKERPVIETVFSPLSVAADLTEDDDAMVRFLREEPELVHGALRAIAETLANFVVECLNAGVDGIFFATTTWARGDRLTRDEYDSFGRPYDLQVLSAASGAPFNVLHVCGPQSYLVELSDYPVHAINWAATDPSNPRVWAFKVPGKASVGGISNKALTVASPNTILAEAKEVLNKTRGRGIIIAGDCTIPVNSRDTHIKALYDYLNVYLPAEG